ncbi:MAG TPA: hypothetical protein VF040_16205 [Ktedonobacterales bacterium]
MTQPLFGAAHCLVQRDQVGTAAVREFHSLEVVPDAFIRVQVGRIAWQSLQMQVLRGAQVRTASGSG